MSVLWSIAGTVFVIGVAMHVFVRLVRNQQWRSKRQQRNEQASRWIRHGRRP